MKLNTKLELFALAVSLATVFWFIYCLAFGWGKFIIFVEPTWWIRIPEIIIGLATIPVLIKMVYDKVVNGVENE